MQGRLHTEKSFFCGLCMVTISIAALWLTASCDLSVEIDS